MFSRPTLIIIILLGARFDPLNQSAATKSSGAALEKPEAR